MPSNEVYSKPKNVVVFYQLPSLSSISILKRIPHMRKGKTGVIVIKATFESYEKGGHNGLRNVKRRVISCVYYP